MRQAVSNACFDGGHEDCGYYAPDGKPCACECHAGEELYSLAHTALTPVPVCDKCGALLSEIEAAGRASGTCNECLRDKEAFPRVGDAATICLWSDRHAATIVYVSPSFKTIRVQTDIATLTSGSIQSETQEYTYEPDTAAREITATRRANGQFRVANGTERVLIGVRAEYRDPSF